MKNNIPSHTSDEDCYFHTKASSTFMLPQMTSTVGSYSINKKTSLCNHALYIATSTEMDCIVVMIWIRKPKKLKLNVDFLCPEHNEFVNFRSRLRMQFPSLEVQNYAVPV